MFRLNLWIILMMLTGLSFKAYAIVGGEFVMASDKEALSTVGLSNGCTGVLITERHVLTAAHCISGAPVSVVFGLSFERGLSIRVQNLIRHADYNGEARGGALPSSPTIEPVHDIAILLLEREAPTGFLPVDIFKEVNLQTGDPLILAGFGQEDPSTGAGFGILRKVDTVFNFYNERALEVVFGPTPGKSACRGDSGGPMYMLQENGGLLLIGLTSRGFFGLGPCSGNGNYTSVDAHKEWIEEALGRLND